MSLGRFLLILIGITFLSALFLLGYQNNFLRNEIATLVKSHATGTYVDPSGKYSFNYPKGLYPNIEKEWIIFYPDKFSAEYTVRCIEKGEETPDHPCGYGLLVFMIYINVDSDKTRLELGKSRGVRDLVDAKKRQWTITKDSVPWTGSAFNMLSHEAITEIDNRSIFMVIAKPSYQYFFDEEEFKSILSSFQLLPN
jgi:hypothetical protein